MSVLHETPLNSRVDERGALVAIEGLADVAFDIKRVYYIFGTKAGVRRGCHAHYRLNQMAVCITGSCRFVMDDGTERAERLLDCHATGLLIKPMVWHEMYDFSPDCVLLVLANAPYDREDYIHHYEQFLELARTAAIQAQQRVA
jgi:dTDP-4-dehydrorhamnose 3,5-epimerase-like enzyme